jgi:hypothetical protein
MRTQKMIGLQSVEYSNKCIRDIIQLDLLNIYKQIENNSNDSNDKEVNIRIKQHRRLINKYNLGGKCNFNTLILLETYKNTKNRSLAKANLMNTLNNKGLFSYFLTGVEKKEKNWSNKGEGKTC